MWIPFLCYNEQNIKNKLLSIGNKEVEVMIDTVVFDIGMVLVYFRWRELYKDLGFEGEMFETIAKATVHNPWWNEFDKGLMSVEEVEEKYIQSAPQYEEEIKKIYQHTDKFVTMYEYTVPWIRELKKRGFKVYVLSNWSEIAYEANKNTHLHFLKEVDGGILSYREGMIKPDREIYQLLCNRYQITPGNAVFLDDNKANVDAAIAFGMKAIHFKTYEQAKKELELLL